MEKFTFSKTDQCISPALSPTTIIIEPERFDIDLRHKRGEAINSFTYKGEYTRAYKPKADSGYNTQTEVIVAIGKLEEPSCLVGNHSTEHYVFKLEDWMRVYEIGVQRERKYE